ncbi:hypothetical protein T484DRAFT_1851727 [Baffinella frigidus]|nr:hypothetical protein T484DRAFT_1851727 [Cryptophyta sp. CCMP2293]
MSASGGVLARAVARVAAGRTGWATTRSFIVRPATSCSSSLPLRVTAARELRLICGALGARAPAGGVRWMSEGGEAKKTKAELQEETVFLRLTGSLDAHTVKINKEKRYLVALEATMKILEKDLITLAAVLTVSRIAGADGVADLLIGGWQEVPGAFTALNDKGLPQAHVETTNRRDLALGGISWPVGKEGAVAEYLAAHDFAAVDAGYEMTTCTSHTTHS